ncbi:MAG: glycoside hydrolase family 2 [Ruminococcaceae bacterium]|nr:glycoside hydrolase family 2 [Oscillospiraceae bacterium]
MPVDLLTKQGEALLHSAETPWDVYPRPQMRRDNWLNLNGPWTLSVEGMTYHIRVPFCPESRLSGIGKHFEEGTCLCYRRSFSLPAGWDTGRVLLHIGAADQTALVYVNGQRAGFHEGGCTAFTLDITEFLEQENRLEIRCFDDLENQKYPYGKQVTPDKRGGMWYTPVSGLWQTVWLENVPTDYIRRLNIENRGYRVTITTEPAMEGTVTVPGLGVFPLGASIAPEDPHLWSPEDPYLYECTVETAGDRVESYFAIRALEIRTVEGIPRLCLNGKPYFFHGLLDQGYWPDGLLTPAAPECCADDILAMKKLGFNTLRKHIKVEPEEFYYQCDKLGMVVFQDMVNNGQYQYFRDTVLPTLGFQVRGDRDLNTDPAARKFFLQTMEATVAQLKNHPSICYWTIFNEGWGQFDSDRVYEKFLELDDTRFVDTTSGWWRGHKTQVDSRHIYFGQWWQLKKGKIPVVLSECGGLTYAEEGHLFNPDHSYGYKTCKTREEFTGNLSALYREHLIPAVRDKGLCAAIYTQVSDVEDEINGLLTYDRAVCKADAAQMQAIARALQDSLE